MNEYPKFRIKPVVRFRENMFGTRSDPSMRDFMSDRPREHQDEVLEYLRSGLIYAIPFGGNLPDKFDRNRHITVMVDGQLQGCNVEMTDGIWFWQAGLIYFVERYNVRLPDEFIEHASRKGWRVDRQAIPVAHYYYDYFTPVES